MLKFLNEDLIPFSKLPDEIIGAMVRLFTTEEYSIQVWDIYHREWQDESGTYPLDYDEIYRIKPIPMPELIIPWELIQERWKYLAVGAKGVWFCEQKPIPNKDNGFYIPHGNYTSNFLLKLDTPKGKTHFEYYGLVIVERPEQC